MSWKFLIFKKIYELKNYMSCNYMSWNNMNCNYMSWNYMKCYWGHTIIQIIIINSQSDILVSFLSVSATNYYHGELFVHDFFHMIVSDLNILAPDKA